MQTSDIKIIGKTFQKLADIVTPTMGAKGRMAVINDEFSRPILTDDGVTVAKECFGLQGFERMIALSVIEAANNTEKAADDGTTLTTLLTNQFYKQGRRWIRLGMQPQIAAEKLQTLVNIVREDLKIMASQIKPEQVKQLAYITTKIPAIGELVEEAYKHAGKSMNIIIEHDRKGTVNSIEYTNGMILDSGYFSGDLRQLCNEGDTTSFKKAHIALLSEGTLTQLGIKKFFTSIPEQNLSDPFVFVFSKSFNPEAMKLLLDTLVENKFRFQFIMINEANPDELFLDIAAKTSGCIQSAALGTSEYEFKFCGLADIVIGIDKTTIFAEADPEQVKQRVEMYKKELSDNQFTTNMVRYATITSRLANLENGVTKIKLAVPTTTEYITLKLKLDDAIGAVKCALKNGVIVGGGKSLYWLSCLKRYKQLKKPLRAPLKTITKNAGIRIKHSLLKKHLNTGYDVVSKKVVNLKEAGIIDSFDSIDTAIENAVSIAANYLKAYIVIKKD